MRRRKRRRFGVKVVRTSVRRAQRRRWMITAMVLCGVLVVGCAGFLCIKYLAGIKPEITQVEIEPCVVENEQTSSLVMKEGEIRMLTVSASEKILDTLEFVSDNTDVLTVDSGGRVDAKKAGEATVTVEGTRFLGKCSVTVKAAEKEKKVSEYTTAIIANTEVVEKNKKNTKKNLYKVTVNRRTNTVTVYTYDENGDYIIPVRAMVCSCGEFTKENITPKGTYSVYFKERWHPLFDDVYGQYVTGFSGPYLFHSVPYSQTSCDTLKSEEFNKLGENASQGCVRLMASDAKWIYSNLKMGTVVEVIDKTASSDPLGRPLIIEILPSIRWDPTDPDKANPYNSKAPVINGAQDVTIEVGDEYESDISAVDTCWQDITDKVTVTGNVISSKAGKYLLTYSVTDNLGKTTEQTITVTVK